MWLLTSWGTGKKQKEQYKHTAVISFTHFNGWLLYKWFNWADVRLWARLSEKVTFYFWALVQVYGESQPKCLSFSFSKVHFCKYSSGYSENAVLIKHCVTCKLLDSAYYSLDTCVSTFLFNPRSKSMNYLYCIPILKTKLDEAQKVN